ncbi:hypothetical protein NLI96_g3379 [Meripilus lineatus]|uniref:CCHC-type domain-containing protein n=1 Tax=Meripilus lineatus TaxID=2056292 RepID=A0AAD5V6V3_9APHY|nr:hypothetical protein NLI96_g3379 [Physisporinus lineatus]
MPSSSPTSMPPRKHRTAPSFDSTDPHSLRQYFQDLQCLFEACGVASDFERKKFAVGYLHIAESDVWTSLPEFDDPETSFKGFQVAIFVLYPETSLDRLYSFVELQKLISNTSQAQLSSLESLATFHRQFLAHSSFLLRNNRLSPREQSQMFLEAIPSDFRSKIIARLQLKFPDHYFEDVHPLSRVFEAAKFVYSLSSAQIAPESSLLPSVPSLDISTQSSSLSTSLDIQKLLEQATQSILDPIVAQLIAASPQSSTSSKPSPASSQTLLASPPTIPIAATSSIRVPKPPRCFYCAGVGHTVQACPTVEEDLALGSCSRTELGRVVLPSGAEIPKGLSGETLRDRLFRSQQLPPSILELQSSSEEPTVIRDGSSNSRAMLFVDSFVQLKPNIAESRRAHRRRPGSSPSIPLSFLPSSTSPLSSQTSPASSQSSFMLQNITAHPSTVFVANSHRKARVTSQASHAVFPASQSSLASSKSHFVAPNSHQSLPISQAIPSNSQHSISPKIAPILSKLARDRRRNLAKHRSTCSESIDAFSTSIFNLSRQLCPHPSQTMPAAALLSPQLPLSSQSSQTSPAVSQSANMSPAAPPLSQKLFPLLQNLQTSSQRPLDLTSTQELRSTSQMSPELLSSQHTSSQVISESPALPCTLLQSTSHLSAQQSPPDFADSILASQIVQTSPPSSNRVHFSPEPSQETSTDIQSSTSRPKLLDFDTWLKEEYYPVALRRNHSQTSQPLSQSLLQPSSASQNVAASSKSPELTPSSSQSLLASPPHPSCAQPSIPWKTRPNSSEIVSYCCTDVTEPSSKGFKSIDAISTSISKVSPSALPQAVHPHQQNVKALRAPLVALTDLRALDRPDLDCSRPV